LEEMAVGVSADQLKRTSPKSNMTALHRRGRLGRSSSFRLPAQLEGVDERDEWVDGREPKIEGGDGEDVESAMLADKDDILRRSIFEHKVFGVEI
jgi:hypothetical protein